MSRNQLQDWVELAEEQGWRILSKPGGKHAFYPPAGSVPPDLRVLNVTEPQGDQHRSFDNIRALLKRAGLKFPEDIKRERRDMQQTAKPNGTVLGTPKVESPVGPTLFTQMRQKINAANDLLSEAAGLVDKIEADSQQLQKLRELLKGI